MILDRYQCFELKHAEVSIVVSLISVIIIRVINQVIWHLASAFIHNEVVFKIRGVYLDISSEIIQTQNVSLVLAP